MKKFKLQMEGKEMLTKDQMKSISGGYLHADCACLHDGWCGPAYNWGTPHPQCSTGEPFCAIIPNSDGVWGWCSNSIWG